jgi:catechol 2,3-dioxygenase-like lactoylglutathione lyase family enzyme
MNQQPHHIALKVLDLAGCEQFYTRVLDLRVMQRNRDRNGSLRSVWFDLGGVILMLERCEAVAPEVEKGASLDPEPVGWHLLALTIAPESRAQWREKLRCAGVRITGETAFSIYFCDPENNRLALSHYPEPEPGA